MKHPITVSKLKRTVNDTDDEKELLNTKLTYLLKNINNIKYCHYTSGGAVFAVRIKKS